MKAGIITAVITIVLLAGGIYLMSQQGRPVEASESVHKLAACMSEKNVTMYGAYWCPHCRNQKAMFGDAFEKVKYVECTQETKTCTEKQVESYPTWIYQDGTRTMGEQPLEKLAEKSGCEYTP